MIPIAKFVITPSAQLAVFSDLAFSFAGLFPLCVLTYSTTETEMQKCPINPTSNNVLVAISFTSLKKVYGSSQAYLLITVLYVQERH